MNKDTAKNYLPLVQALADGKVIQGFYRKSDSSGAWLDLEGSIVFDAPADQYRIKPEPKEIWMNRYPNGVESGPYDSEQEAHRLRANDTSVSVRYREVIE